MVVGCTPSADGSCRGPKSLILNLLVILSKGVQGSIPMVINLAAILDSLITALIPFA